MRSSGVDIRSETLAAARLVDLERLAAFMRVDVGGGDPDREDPYDLELYKRALVDAIARRTDRKFFRR